MSCATRSPSSNRTFASTTRASENSAGSSFRTLFCVTCRPTVSTVPDRVVGRPYPEILARWPAVAPHRPAFEADPKKVEPLASAITRAHQAVLGGTPKPASPPFSSMWRDINCFNEMRIPSVTYGPGVSVGGGNFGIRIADLVTGTKLYALTALELCNRTRS